MFTILFENEDILAVNKPEGIASIPEREKEKSCLFTIVSSLSAKRLYAVHRLDKEVSGAIIFAKNETSHKFLNDQFSNQSVHKTYVALTHGIIRDASGVIDKAIREFGSGRMGVDPKAGKPCVTEYRIAERFMDYTLVKVMPKTGRRHQIRVHFYSIGHPLVGDLRYGDRRVSLGFPRLMLHAEKIGIKLLSGEKVIIEAQIPESFKRVIDMISKL